jgi:hypothetical protein
VFARSEWRPTLLAGLRTASGTAWAPHGKPRALSRRTLQPPKAGHPTWKSSRAEGSAGVGRRPFTRFEASLRLTFAAHTVSRGLSTDLQTRQTTIRDATANRVDAHQSLTVVSQGRCIAVPLRWRPARMTANESSRQSPDGSGLSPSFSWVAPKVGALPQRGAVEIIPWARQFSVLGTHPPLLVPKKHGKAARRAISR